MQDDADEKNKIHKGSNLCVVVLTNDQAYIHRDVLGCLSVVKW
jgi:hypothetical protein